MKKILILSIMCVFITSAQAQFLKKLKVKANQSASNVKTKVKQKAETAPERVIDHTANKIENKAANRIDSIEMKANNKVDKTVDKTDSIKIKKAPAKEPKDSLPDSSRINFSDDAKKKMENVQLTKAQFYSPGNNAVPFLYDRKTIFI